MDEKSLFQMRKDLNLWYKGDKLDYIFKIGVDDAQHIARKRIGRELTIEELERVQKGVEFGLELSWDVVVKAAIDEMIEN